MKDNLSHILDESACLNSRQMKDYINNCVTRDECHAIEHHLNNCTLCSEAIEGIRSADIGVLDQLASFNTQFFRDRILPPPGIQSSRNMANRNSSRHSKNNKTLIALIATSLLIIIVVTMLKEFIRL